MTGGHVMCDFTVNDNYIVIYVCDFFLSFLFEGEGGLFRVLILIYRVFQEVTWSNLVFGPIYSVTHLMKNLLTISCC